MAQNKKSGNVLLSEKELNEVRTAVKDGNSTKLVEYLASGWNVNQPLDELGRTALHKAAERGRSEVVRVLVQGGANVDVQDKMGMTPLYRAARRGHTDTVKVMLANKASVDVRDKSSETPLHWAAEGGHTDIVKKLLANKASVDVRTERGGTPLHWAAGEGHTDTVEVMLANKASVDVRDKWGRTPLHTAARYGHTATVKVMLANKASVDVRNKSGDTPLHVASAGGHTEVVKLLCRESGCDINTVNEKGNTPLHRACKFGHLDVVKLLVEEDGDVTVVNKAGETAYDVCGRGRGVKESTAENIKEFLKEELFRRAEYAAPPIATIDGAVGGVFGYKGVQLRVPPNAISGKIEIEFVDQLLLARAVRYDTQGRAILYSQRICVTCTDGDLTFSEPVEVRVTVAAMLGKVDDRRRKSEDFRILHENDGEVTDITEDCNVRQEWKEIVFYSKTCSMVNIAWLADFTSPITTGVFTTIKHILEASYMCRICPYIKERQDGGLIVKLFCHGVDVECTDDIEHECTSYKMRLINSATLLFGVVCWSIEDDKKKQISSKGFKLERDHCERACTVFEMIEASVRALVADKVRLCVMEIIYKETLMDGAVKVHEESAISAQRKKTSNRERRVTGKLHQQLLHEVAERVIGRDFERLKGLCEDWIKPTKLQNITNTHKLFEQLQQQAIINVGDYSKLTHMLHQLHLEELKDRVETLSREIKAPGMREVLLSPDDKANGIIRVEQPLLMQAVREEFEDGTVYLHPQRVCLQTGVPAFTVLVTMKVDVSDILTQLGDDKDPSSFFILRLSNGEVTDITTQCNAQLHGQELVYSCRHFSEHVIGWTEYFSKVFSFIRDYLKGTFRAKFCPSAKKEKFGVSLSLLCHEDGANCPEHPCETEYPSELHCQQEIMFLAEIKCTREDVEKRSDPMKVDREICKQTGMRIDEWQSVEDRELGDVVVMKVYQLSKENKVVLLRSRKVQIQKDTTPESPSTPACLPSKLQVHQQANRIEQPLLKQDDREEFRVGVAMSQIGQVQFARSIQKDTTAESPSTCAYPSEEQKVPDRARELHRELLREVDDSLIQSDFKRLKAECKDWIKPAQLEKITDTLELLDEFEKQEIIKCGEYRNLIDMLGVLNLNQLKGRVEGLSRAINALGIRCGSPSH